MRSLTVSILATICGAAAIAAQTPPAPAVDGARCDSVLASPTTDSVLERIGIVVVPFEAEQRIDSAYLALIAGTFGQMLALPRPLPLDTYEPHALPSAPGGVSTTRYVVQTLRSFYDVELHWDGHLTRPRVAGGVHGAQLDAAVLRALVALDSLRLVPQMPDGEAVDSVGLGVGIMPDTIVDARAATGVMPPKPGSVPLFVVRLPVRAVSAQVRQLSSTRAPYPALMWRGNIEGQVLAEFVVGVDSIPDPTSIRVLRAPHMPFAQSVVETLPKERYAPLEIGGCPVRALVRQPFMFTLHH